MDELEDETKLVSKTSPEWIEYQEQCKKAILSIKDWETKLIRKFDNPSFNEHMMKFKKREMWRKPIPYWYSLNTKRKALQDVGIDCGLVFDTDELKDEFVNWVKGDYKAPYFWFLNNEMREFKKNTPMHCWKEYYETEYLRKRGVEELHRIETWKVELDGFGFGLPEKKWWQFWK